MPLKYYVIEVIQPPSLATRIDVTQTPSVFSKWENLSKTMHLALGEI